MMNKGLSTDEVNERIKQGKQNKPSATKTKKVAEILIENILSVFNLIIFSIVIFLTIFYFIEDDQRLLLDLIGVSLVAITNTLIAIIEEIRAKKALDKVNALFPNSIPSKDLNERNEVINSWYDGIHDVKYENLLEKMDDKFFSQQDSLELKLEPIIKKVILHNK